MAINQEIISTSWEGQQKSYIEAGMKTLLQRMLEVLESPLAANSVGSNQLTQELRDVINSIGSKVPNTRTVNRQPLNADVTIGPGDIMVGNQTLADKLDDMDEAIGQGGDTSGLATRIAALESSLNTLTGANDTTQIIDTFNEVIDFLASVNNDETLLGKLQQLQTQINSKANDNAVVKGIKANGASETLPVVNGIVELPPAGSTISPATAAPSMDGTASVGISDKYAREDHVHPRDTSKANASDVYTKTQTDTLLSGKQNTLTFDNAPTAGSNNPVKSGGIKTALDAKANAADVPTKTEMADAIDDAFGKAEVTVVPANSVGIITSLGSDSNEDALSASMGKKLKIAILQIYSSLGAYAFPDGKPNLDFDDIITYSVAKTIGTGLSASGVPTEVLSNQRLEVSIAITNNLYIIDDDSVVVTMGGQLVAGAWNAGTMKVTIGTVTGNVVINVPSMTYVDVDGSNNQLAFMLDCKNRGGQSGHWIDLIGNKDFALTDVTEADDGMVFNGLTSKGVASGSLDVYYYNNTYGSATIEAVVDMSSFTPSTGQRLPILANTLDGRVAASFRTNDKGVQMIGCATNTTGADDPNSNTGFFFTKNNKSFGTTGGTDGGIVVVDGNVPENPRAAGTPGQEPSDVHDYFAGLSSSFAVGYGNISSTNYYFKGKILAIRVYKTKLTAQQIIYNHNIDKKRFNLA